MKEKKLLKSKYILLIFVIICLFMILLSLFGKGNKYIDRFLGGITVPVEKTFTKAGNFLDNKFNIFGYKSELLNENNSLTTENAELKEQIAALQLEISQLEAYKDLYELDNSYAQYSKIAANVVAKDNSKWFSSFKIDKGSNDGIAIGMNVITGGGLVGKVVSVGNNWAQVRSIIDSDSYVSVMATETGDYGIVNGSLELREDGCVELEQFYDSDNNTQIGYMIVTSNVSDVYWPGILIGYISELTTDENNLTKSGKINLAVDFEHLEHVFVITDMKEVTEN